MRWPALILAGWTAGACWAGVPEQAQRYRADLIRNAHVVWGLDAPIATFAAQIHQESMWRSGATSAYASGLAQFTPATATWISGAYRLGEPQPFNPSWALRALVTYDRHLWERIGTYDTLCDRMLFALSDYNGGPGWRMKRQALSLEPAIYVVTSRINPGIRPANQQENEQYPVRIVYQHQPLYSGWGRGACT